MVMSISVVCCCSVVLQCEEETLHTVLLQYGSMDSEVMATKLLCFCCHPIGKQITFRTNGRRSSNLFITFLTEVKIIQRVKGGWKEACLKYSCNILLITSEQHPYYNHHSAFILTSSLSSVFFNIFEFQECIVRHVHVGKAVA